MPDTVRKFQPDSVAKTFFQHLDKRQYDKAYSLCQLSWKKEFNIHKMKAMFLDRYQDVQVVRNIPKTDACIDVVIAYTGREGMEHTRLCRMIKETAPYEPSVIDDGYWGINPTSTLRTI